MLTLLIIAIIAGWLVGQVFTAIAGVIAAALILLPLAVNLLNKIIDRAAKLPGNQSTIAILIIIISIGIAISVALIHAGVIK